MEIRKPYAESLRRSKFVLCPRGNGVGSVRLFETMQTGRVPVIISDAYVLPRGVDWGQCALRVPENKIHRLPEILSAHEARWEGMAKAARSTWERLFSPAVLLDEMGRLLSEIDSASKSTRRHSGKLNLLACATIFKSKALLRRFRG